MHKSFIINIIFLPFKFTPSFLFLLKSQKFLFLLKSQKFLFLLALVSAQKFRRNKMVKPKFEAKQEFHMRNSAILLEKQIALSKSHGLGLAQLRILSSEDLARATDDYDPKNVIGSRNYNTLIYKGTIEGRIFAIKATTQLEATPELVDIFLTEASTMMITYHCNVVKLYGCCLETYVPILVYEFVPNSCVYEHLHVMEWDACLKVACDAAYGLCYLHTAFSKPLVHRDVTSQSILLDHSFGAKLANVVCSVSVSAEERPQLGPIKGTPGYIDPEYNATQEVTVKSDVYSFGVLMLELLTKKDPQYMVSCGTDLVDEFRSAYSRGTMMEMVDDKVKGKATNDEINPFAELALSCVAMKGIERPTMKDVVKDLWRIRDM